MPRDAQSSEGEDEEGGAYEFNGEWVKGRDPFEQALSFIRSLGEEQLILRWVNYIYQAYQLQEFEVLFENTLRLKYQDSIPEARPLKEKETIVIQSDTLQRIQLQSRSSLRSRSSPVRPKASSRGSTRTDRSGSLKSNEPLSPIKVKSLPRSADIE